MLKRSLTVLLLCVYAALGCGGGLMAYTPSSGNDGSGNKKADFYFINKGVSTTMFDVKALQPVFREVTASGNERNDKNLSKRAKQRLEKKQKEEMVDTTVATHNPAHHHNKEDVAPVLNLHKLH